jgi:hypothetical protein
MQAATPAGRLTGHEYRTTVPQQGFIGEEHLPQLTVNYSAALVDLLKTGSIPIDGIEMGSWYTPEQVRSFRRSLPDLPFTYHAGSLAASLQTQK